jgi:chromosome segregation ATPase
MANYNVPPPSTQELIDTLRERVNDLEEQNRDAERRVTNWRQNYYLMQRQRDDARHERTNLEARVMELEADINPDTGRYHVVEEMEVKISELTEDREALDRVNASLTEENERLRDEKDSPKGVEYWRNVAVERSARIDLLRSQNDDLKQKLAELTTKRAIELGEKNSRIRQLEQDNNNLYGEIHGTTGPWAKLRTAEAKARSLQQMLDAKEAEIRDRADQSGKIAALETVLQLLRAEIRHHDQRIQTLRSTLVQRTAERDEAKQRIGRLNDTLAVQERNLGAVERELRVAKDDLIKQRGVNSVPDSHQLVIKWRDAEARKADQLRELGEWGSYGVSRTITAVLTQIIMGRAPRSS